MDYPVEVLYNSASVITVPVLSDLSVETSPTTATYTIFHPGGNVLQASTSATVSGSYVSISWPGAASYLENYRCDMVFNFSASQVSGRSFYFDAVVMVLNQLLTDDELYDEYPLLDNLKWTNETDWRRFKRAAWRDIRSSIASRGYRPALCAPSSTAFVLPHKHLTLAKIFKSLFETVGDEWHEKWKFHDDMYQATMGGVLSNLKYDAGEVKNIAPGQSWNVNSYKIWR